MPKVKKGKAVKTAKPKVTKKEKPEVELKPYQDKGQLEQMYPKMTAGEISRKFNVSRAVILHYLRKHGIEITTRVSPKTGPKFFKENANRSYQKKKWLKAQLEKGLSIYKISVICKVGFANIKRYVEKFGLMPLVVEQRAKAKAEKSQFKEDDNKIRGRNN